MIMDDEPILLSWISQWVFCKRRFYLQIAEQNFIENVFTAEGARDHKRAHECKIERRGTHIKVTGLQVVSEKYHLFGICDSVEFEVVSDGCYIPFLEETCRIYPVEYKHGKKRDEEEYNLQMAAQTLCLEEMFHTTITTGYIYYTGSKERFEVNISDKVRADAVKFIREISSYLENPHPIKPELRKRCNGCSLNDLCNPRKILVQDYMECIRKKYIV
ncbi:CRISPR-associated protein Cas4 [Clostridium sp. AF37-5AT]|jgi:CRISPR-associated exonuclease Cas4|nr:CRISPR-associated protein Cas4 [Clostridium sp. AF37-5AT]